MVLIIFAGRGKGGEPQCGAGRGGVTSWFLQTELTTSSSLSTFSPQPPPPPPPPPRFLWDTSLLRWAPFLQIKVTKGFSSIEMDIKFNSGKIHESSAWWKSYLLQIRQSTGGAEGQTMRHFQMLLKWSNSLSDHIYRGFQSSLRIQKDKSIIEVLRKFNFL